MEQLYLTTGIYGDIFPNQTKESAEDVSNSLSTAFGEEKAKLREFFSFIKADGPTEINGRPLLKGGGTDKSGYCAIM